MHKPLTILLALILFLAGCTSNGSKSPQYTTETTTPDAHCGNTPCPTPTDTDPTTTLAPSPEPGDNETSTGLLQLQGCDEHGGLYRVHESTLRPHVPPAFELSGAGDVVSVFVDFLDCDRGVTGATILPENAVYMAVVFVHPVDDSWDDPRALDYWILDLATNNGDTGAFFADVETDAALATITGTNTTLPDGTIHFQWEAKAADWSALFDTTLPNRHQPRDYEFAADLWYGNGPFTRTSWTLAATGGYPPTAGDVVHQGESTMTEIAPTSPTVGNYWSDGDYVYQFDADYGE